MDSRDDIASRVSSDGGPPSKRRRTSNIGTQVPREVGLMRSLPGDAFSSFVGSASGIYFIRSVYGAIRHSNPSSGAQIQTPESDIVPGEDDHLPSATPDIAKRLWKDNEVTAQYNSKLLFDDLVAWSGSYFANWHPAYPFLYAPAILKFFEKIAQDGLSPDIASQNLDMIILRSIMSISLADGRQNPTSSTTAFPTALVFQSYDAAINSLSIAFSRPTTIQSLQAAISVQLFLVSMLRLSAASRLGGIIIRMALQLGLHRCPNRFPSFSHTERELRQRIFWSLYCIDRSICQSMGLPLSLRDDDIDVCYPSKERHLAQPKKPDHRLSLLEFLARHSQIRGQIMELRNKSILHSKKETDQADVITAKLTRWWNEVEELVDSDEDDSPAISMYHRTVLTILHHESVISLNRPVLAVSIKGSAYDVALQLCICSSRSIITTLHRAIALARSNDQPRVNLSLLWYSFTWAVWMSTFVLFHAANNKHVSQAMTTRLAERGLDILKHLSGRGSVWPEACAAAIRDLKIQLSQKPSSPRTDTVIQYIPQIPTLQQSHSPSTNRPRTAQVSSNQIGVPSNRSPNGLTNRMASHQDSGLTQNAAQTSGSNASPSIHTSLSDSRNADLTQPPQLTRNHDLQRDILPGHVGNTTGTGPADEILGNLPWDVNLPINNGLSQEPALPGDDAIDPFAGFDIPFWIGQDQYSNMVNEWS